MATEIVKTIRASGGDYTTLSAWEAALPASLVTADEQHTAVCYNDWPSGLDEAITIAGSITDATRFIKVTVASGHRHDGSSETGFYVKHSPATTTQAVLLTMVGYTVIDGVEVQNTRADGIYSIVTNATTCAVKNAIAKAVGGRGYSGIFGTTSGATRVSLINCLAIDSLHGFGRSDSVRSRYNAYNCTAVNCDIGFASGSTNKAAIQNCVAYGSTTIDFENQVDATNSGYNASSDSSASVFTGGVTGVVDADFVDATGGDYHLASGSALIGVGSNLYSLFTDDIDGDIRPSSGAWDIGFDHYVATGGPAAELDGDATATATATGTLTTQIPLSGAAAVITTAAGALSTQIALAGAAATVSSAAGSLSASITLSGAALSQALAAAGLTTAIALAGTAAGAAQADGELASGAAQLAGVAAATASSIASLTTQIALSGAALAAALASGDLSATPAGLAGSAAAGASATGALLTQIPLTAAAEASTTAAGGLTTIIQLAGAAASISSATGALLVEFTLSGTALAQVLAGGDLTTIIQLDAAAVARAAASGSLGGGSGVPAILRHLVEAFAADWTVEAAPGPWEVYA